MYNCMQKLILKYAGASNVPVIAPNQSNSFYKEFLANVESSSKSSFMKDMWAALMGVELLHKVVLRVRPFAKDRDEAQKIYDKSVKGWIELIETRPDMKQMSDFMQSAAFAFSCIEVDRDVERPRIGIVGEIYVRNHPFANRSIIQRLESLGAACDLASVAEWVYYTNFIRGKRAGRRLDLSDWLSNATQNYFQRKVEKTLAAPLESKFGRLAEEPVERTLEAATPYMHHSFLGEAILSVGKMVEYHHHGMGGVVNVMPFSCMPSTIVSTQTMRISAQCDDMPVLNLSFDGQDDPAMTTRLEAFVDQVRQKQTCTAATVMG
jgi:predicted nucleotide-binding protein (sugar kinase/HSP70/actin superfamily)